MSYFKLSWNWLIDSCEEVKKDVAFEKKIISVTFLNPQPVILGVLKRVKTLKNEHYSPDSSLSLLYHLKSIELSLFCHLYPHCYTVNANVYIMIVNLFIT